MIKTAIYPGSFDPPTMGHIDIIERAHRISESVVIGIGVNGLKASWLFTVEERIQMLQDSCKHLRSIRVKWFDGLLMDFAKQEQAQVIVRGLRAVSDFESEFQMAHMNRRLEEEIETLFMMTNKEYAYLSSSLIREVASLGGNIDGLVPDIILSRVKQKFAAYKRG